MFSLDPKNPSLVQRVDLLAPDRELEAEVEVTQRLRRRCMLARIAVASQRLLRSWIWAASIRSIASATVNPPPPTSANTSSRLLALGIFRPASWAAMRCLDDGEESLGSVEEPRVGSVHGSRSGGAVETCVRVFRG